MLPLFAEKKALPTKQGKSRKKSHPSGRFSIRGNKIYFISLGCPRNLVDSEVMIGILLKAGYSYCSALEEADIVVINTCGFLEASREESRQTIAEVLEHKKEEALTIVTGCMVQNHAASLAEAFPEVHAFIGSGDVEKILEAVEKEEADNYVTEARSYLEAGEIPRRRSTPGHYAYLKIAEGCRKRCAFCIIPSIKGKLQSKSKEQVKKEVDLLLNQGVREIILIAQDLGDYGKDQGYRRSEGLLELLRDLLATERMFSLRLLYLYPDEITDELIALIKEDRRILPYLDMPIQHVHDEMLRKMHRATTHADLVRILTRLRQEIPEVVVRTSLMVGFPGETEEHFASLLDFVAEHPLDNVGIFTFSREKGSYAYDLPDQIPEAVKEERYHRLLEAQSRVVQKRSRHLIGKIFPAFVEGYHPESNLLMRGRYYGQCPDIDGMIVINDGRAVDAFGELYAIEITDAHGYDLVGRVLGRSQSMIL